MRLSVNHHRLSRPIAAAIVIAALSVGLTSATAHGELEVSPAQLRALVQEALYWEAVCAPLMPVNGEVVRCAEPTGGWVPVDESDWWDDYLRIMRGG